MSREGKARVLTPEEFKRAEGAALLTRHSLRNRTLLYLSYSLALRACELRRLRIRDVLSPDGKLFDEINLLKCMTKGKKQRHTCLSNKKAREILKEYLKHLAEKNRGNLRYDDYLFSSQKGGEFHPVSMVIAINDIYKKAGLVGARSHSGRRTFITNKIDEGYDIVTIATFVGHDDINTTRGYAETNPTKLKKMASKSIF
jgi:integrase/recombinase XerD